MWAGFDIQKSGPDFRVWANPVPKNRRCRIVPMRPTPLSDDELRGHIRRILVDAADNAGASEPDPEFLEESVNSLVTRIRRSFGNPSS